MEQSPDNIETGASEGDARGNSPDAPGFTSTDKLFRSHFQHANRMADWVYDDVRPAYMLGYRASLDMGRGEQSFEDMEKDLEAGWMNVRTHTGDWTSVRDLAREGFERGRRIGYVDETPALGGTQRASYSDPVADGIDPTSPESPEQTFERKPPERAD